MFFDTDLILEATELWQNGQDDIGKKEGIVTHERQAGAVTITEVEVLTEEGAQSVGKPIGRYLTLDMGQSDLRSGEIYQTTAETLAKELKTMLPDKKGLALVLGLGNRGVTPDAVGPWAVDEVFVTRHLVEYMPQQFGSFRPVAATAAGVLGTTGVESGEWAAALCRQLHPTVVIAIDALAARSPSRLCTTIQLSDSGIVPGSGVGNARHALNHDSLGVPVLAVGVPTVIRAAALTDEPREELGDLIVTPSDIDQRAELLAKLLGEGISLALQEGEGV